MKEQTLTETSPLPSPYFLRQFSLPSTFSLPRVPEVFLACGEAARKTSGTERCFLPSPLTFELFYRITFTPIRLKVSDCVHLGRHVKKCPKNHIILRKTSSSLKFIAGHYKDLTETGNRVRKVSGTQGTFSSGCQNCRPDLI